MRTCTPTELKVVRETVCGFGIWDSVTEWRTRTTPEGKAAFVAEVMEEFSDTPLSPAAVEFYFNELDVQLVASGR